MTFAHHRANTVRQFVALTPVRKGAIIIRLRVITNGDEDMRTPEPRLARIVSDSREASLDRLIRLEDAMRMWEEGKLNRLDMGSAYPYAFEIARSGR